jgi:hypothetical protein
VAQKQRPKRPARDRKLAADIQLIEDWLDESNRIVIRTGRAVPLGRTRIGKSVHARDDAGAIRFVRAYLTWMLDGNLWDATLAMVTPLFQRDLPFIDTDLIFMADGSAKMDAYFEWPLAGIVTAIERHADRRGLSSGLRSALRRMRKAVEQRGARKAERSVIARLDRLLGGSGVTFAIDPGEPWALRLKQDVGKMPPARKGAWTGLLAHAQSATGSAPPPAWLKQARGHVEGLGRAEFLRGISGWFPLFAKPRTSLPPGLEYESFPEYLEKYVVSEPNELLLKGLIWTCRASPNPRFRPLLEKLMAQCLEDDPDAGKRFAEGGTACKRALEALR